MRNLIDAYLSHREIIIEKLNRKKVNAGVPQGSVLGPMLWNIQYDRILKTQLKIGVSVIAFADDLLIAIEAEDAEELCRKGNNAIEDILEKMGEKLEVAEHKTEALILKGPRKRQGITFRVGRGIIQHQKKIKYLGVVVDNKMMFGQHNIYATKKAEDRLAVLSRMMTNIGGPSSKKRQMLYGVVQSILLYGAPIWCEALKLTKYRNLINSTQRKALLRVTSAYRTVSTVAVQVIAGVPPIHLLAEERVRLYKREDGNTERAKNAERETTLKKWNQEWTKGSEKEKSPWTKIVIHNLKGWVKSMHRETDYYLTQFLSGHGAFGTYTKRIGKTETTQCISCGENNDTPEHTVLHCPRWLGIREDAETKVGRLTKENLVEIMLEGKKEWKVVHDLIRQVMKEKETLERAIQADQAM